MRELVSLDYLEGYDIVKLENAVRESFLRLDLTKSIKPNMKVMLKVCIPCKANADQAETTNPNLVAAVINVLSEMKVKCIVADCPMTRFSPNKLESIYINTGMLEVNNLSPCELNRNFETEEVAFEAGVKAKSFTFLKLAQEVDAIINLSKLKIDEDLGFMGSSSNMFGLIPGSLKNVILNRMERQSDFNNYIIDINECLKDKVILNITDAIVALEAGKTPRMMFCLAMSKNTYCLDACLVDILGIDQDRTLLKLAKERGLIENVNCYNTIGKSVEDFKVDDFALYDFDNFTEIKIKSSGNIKKYKKFQKYPEIKPNICKGCGYCEKVCPVGAISMKYDKDGELYASIDYKKCVYCYRCVAACPYTVIRTKSNLRFKMIERTLKKYNKS